MLNCTVFVQYLNPDRRKCLGHEITSQVELYPAVILSEWDDSDNVLIIFTQLDKHSIMYKTKLNCLLKLRLTNSTGGIKTLKLKFFFTRKLFHSIRFIHWRNSKKVGQQIAWQIMIWVFWLLCFQTMAQAGRRGHLIPPLRRFKVYESIIKAFYESFFFKY